MMLSKSLFTLANDDVQVRGRPARGDIPVLVLTGY